MIVNRWILSIIFLSSLVFSSCGEMRDGQRGRGVSSIGTGISTASPFAGDEASIAYAACNALRVKDSRYRVDHLNQGFYWQLKHASCTGAKTTTDITSKLKAASASSPLYYDSDFGGFYFKDVETHNYGLLAKVCDSVLKGQETSNSVTEGNLVYQYHFYVDGQQVKVQVVMGSEDINENSETHGQFLTIREDVLTINTSSNSSDSMTGLIESRIRTIPCPGNGVESFTQNFLHHSGYTD